jgi:hypothetical protein
MNFVLLLFSESSLAARTRSAELTKLLNALFPSIKQSVEIHIVEVEETGGPVFSHGTRPAFLMSLVIARRRVGMH